MCPCTPAPPQIALLTHRNTNTPPTIQLFQAYQEQYRAAQAKLQQMPKGKQFDFPEPLIFGRFEVRMYVYMYVHSLRLVCCVCGPSPHL